MEVRPWSSSVHRLTALNLKIEELETELERLYAERDWLCWKLDEGDHSE